MEIFQTIWNVITTPNTELIGILTIPLGFLEIYLYVLLFNTILNLNANFKQKLIYIISYTLLGSLSNLIARDFAIIINIILVPALIMIIFRTTILKGFISTIFPLVIQTLLSTLISKIYFVSFGIDADILTNIPIYRISFMLLIYLSMFSFYLLTKHFNINISLLDNMNKKNRNLLILNSILGLICLSSQYYLTVYYIDKLPIFITLLSIVSIFTYFFISIYSLTRTTKLEIANQDLEESQLYNKSLRILHDNIRAFKHDFNNIVQAIGGYIATEDLDGLKQYYSQLLDDCQRVNNLTLLSPDVINNPAIYSLLTSKYHRAEELGIKINLEIFMDLATIHMKIYEFTRILGILLDNAIESASQCDEKVIYIELRKDSKRNKQLIIIKNTYSNQELDMSKLFEKGYSTKPDKENHGLGLWEVNQILRKNNNLVELVTNRYDGLFVQQLEITIPS